MDEIDFTAKPSSFKVQGLLTLPPLKMLAGGMLPPLQLHQQVLRCNPQGGQEQGLGTGPAGAAGAVGARTLLY